MNRSIVPLVLGMLSGLSRKEDRPAVIPSVKIEQKEEVEQLSKQKIAKMKGKKNRINRGRNRRKKNVHEDTAIYSTLRR